jgi:hypothetical protein
MKPNYDKIDAQFEKIADRLINRIEELASKVVKANEGITGFCMGMGCASFGVDFIEVDDGDEYQRDDDLDPHEMLLYPWKHEECIKEIDYIIDRYDSNSHVTGSPVRITKENGKIVVEYDW